MVARSKKGFTLVELMVVIAIIGILAAALVTPITNARATGQAVRCKTNLKNLAQAALSYAVENSYMPFAESYENHNMEKDGDDYRRRYRHRIGWVSCTWSGSNPWPSWDSSKGAVLSSGQAQFWGDKDTTFHSITNGSLWSHVGKDLARYLCDAHTAACRRERIDTQNTPVRRSYVMNAYFGGDFRFGGSATAPYVERYLSDVAARLQGGGREVRGTAGKSGGRSFGRCPQRRHPQIFRWTALQGFSQRDHWF
jgi:prepilin-type N-terminal cleavage/methylation domain-containing protein